MNERSLHGTTIRNARASMSRLLIGLLIGLLLPVGAHAANSLSPAPLSERDRMTLRVIQLARSGQVDQARSTLDTYLQAHPTDGTMYYNLTCLDLVLRDTEHALASLEKALANGYTNFRLMESDPDLQSLRDDPRYQELVAAAEASFQEDFQSRALLLDEGYPGREVELPSNVSGADAAVRAFVSAVFDRVALRVRLDVADAGYSDAALPWEGGSGVLVNLILPLSPEDYESRRYFSLGFHAAKGRPAAVLIARHGQVLMQPVPGLEPVIEREGDRVRYDITIPWEQFAPYAPPLDQELGLNVFYLARSAGPSREVCALMPETRLSFEASPWRRYVPVSFLDSDRSAPVLRGRLYNRLCESDSLGLQLALRCREEGTAEARFRILDDDGAPLQPPVAVDFPAEADLNFFNANIDVAGLPVGSYRLRTELQTPDGDRFEATYAFDRFEKGWVRRLDERIHELKTREQSTLKYHLFRLARRLERRHPQDPAGALRAAYAEVAGMVVRCEQGGSCLPENGLFRGGFSTDAMTHRFCSMYLPTGYREFETPQVLMVLPPEPGSEDALAVRIGSALEGRSETIVLVPQSSGDSSIATDRAAAHTIQAMQWAQELFGSGAVTLAGIGQGSDAALEASLQRPDLCQEILLDGEQLFHSLASLDGESVRRSLGERPNRRPYYLTARDPSTGRAAVVAAALQQSGYQTLGFAADPARPWSERLAEWFLQSR